MLGRPGQVIRRDQHFLVVLFGLRNGLGEVRDGLLLQRLVLARASLRERLRWRLLFVARLRLRQQRVKIAAELSKLQKSKHTVYILDEPTTGLHLADVVRLLESLNRLVDAGHTVLLIDLDVIKIADHVIDLGPEGGHAGGEVVVTGTPEQIAACKASYTGSFLKTHLRTAK